MGYVGWARAAAVTWLLGAAVYLVCEAAAAASVTGYSYAGDYISDLGVTAVMNVGAFVVHGVLFLLGALLVSRACPIRGWILRSFVAAAFVNAIGNILVGTFRSGVPVAAGQLNWHVVGAGLAILGGNAAVIIAGIEGREIPAAQGFRRASIGLGSIGIGCLLVLIADGVGEARALPVGLVERGAVYSIIAWEILAGVTILRRPIRAVTCER